MYRLCVIPGDGIGAEVVPAAVAVLERVIPGLETVSAEAGWACFEKYGVSVPTQTLDQIRACGAGLFGAVSSPSRKVAGYRSAILTMRQELNLFANIRPIYHLPGVSPEPPVDLVVVRENTEGLYAGRERREGDTAIAERIITRSAGARIAEVAAQLADQRPRKRLTIVHKANVLPETDGLFRDTVRQVAEKNDDLEINEMLVDLAALQMVADPARFDVIVTTNLFGDILSDVAAYWMGGLGFAPSLNLGDGVALAEPVHGSAPDIAGKGVANPTAAILSAAMLVRYHWRLPDIAARIERAVQAVSAMKGKAPVRTEAVLEEVLHLL